MAKIDRMMVGESLVGDGNEVAHIDLIIGPRGTAGGANAITIPAEIWWNAALARCAMARHQTIAQRQRDAQAPG